MSMNILPLGILAQFMKSNNNNNSVDTGNDGGDEPLTLINKNMYTVGRGNSNWEEKCQEYIDKGVDIQEYIANTEATHSCRFFRFLINGNFNDLAECISKGSTGFFMGTNAPSGPDFLYGDYYAINNIDIHTYSDDYIGTIYLTRVVGGGYFYNPSETLGYYIDSINIHKEVDSQTGEMVEWVEFGNTELLYTDGSPD